MKKGALIDCCGGRPKGKGDRIGSIIDSRREEISKRKDAVADPLVYLATKKKTPEGRGKKTWVKKGED